MRKTYLDGMTLDEKVKYLDETVANFEANGIQGTPGQDGADGQDGVQGAQGLQGIPGLQGPEGPQGIPGNGSPGPDSTQDIIKINADLVAIKTQIAAVPNDIATITANVNALLARVNALVAGGVIRGHFATEAEVHAIANPNNNDLAFAIDPLDSTRYDEYIYVTSAWVKTGGGKSTTAAPQLKPAVWVTHPSVTFTKDPANSNISVPNFTISGKSYTVTDWIATGGDMLTMLNNLFPASSGARYRIKVDTVPASTQAITYMYLEPGPITIETGLAVYDTFIKVRSVATSLKSFRTSSSWSDTWIHSIGVRDTADTLIGIYTVNGTITSVNANVTSMTNLLATGGVIVPPKGTHPAQTYGLVLEKLEVASV